MHSNRVATKAENGDLEVEAEVPFFKLSKFPLRASSPTVTPMPTKKLIVKNHLLPFSISLCLGVLLSA